MMSYKITKYNQSGCHYLETPVTTYSVLQVLRNSWTKQHTTSLALDRSLDLCIGRFNDISVYDYNYPLQLKPKRRKDLFKSPDISLPLLAFDPITNNPPSNQNRSFNNRTQATYHDSSSSSQGSSSTYPIITNKHSDSDTISDLDSKAETFDLLDLTNPGYNPGHPITSKIFLTNPSENLPTTQNTSFHSNFLPETTT